MPLLSSMTSRVHLDLRDSITENLEIPNSKYLAFFFGLILNMLSKMYSLFVELIKFGHLLRHFLLLISDTSVLLSSSQAHLREKMATLEEKNSLNAELDRIRRVLEETRNEKSAVSQDNERLRKQVSAFKLVINSLSIAKKRRLLRRLPYRENFIASNKNWPQSGIIKGEIERTS